MRSIGIPDDLWADVHTIARARAENVSVVIRRALIEYRERHLELLIAERATQREAG
jgi:hypothetical protein